MLTFYSVLIIVDLSEIVKLTQNHFCLYDFVHGLLMRINNECTYFTEIIIAPY